MAKIPYNRFIDRRKGRSGASRVKCEKCGKIKRMLHMALFKDKILCSNCRPHIINSIKRALAHRKAPQF